jgi:hypothetical protein
MLIERALRFTSSINPFSKGQKFAEMRGAIKIEI